MEKEWSVTDKFLTDYKQVALALDSLETSHPINVEVNHPNQISEIFDAISYRKGTYFTISVIHIMHITNNA